MKDFEVYHYRQIVARPFDGDTRMQRWIEVNRPGVRMISFGERGMVLYNAGFPDISEINTGKSLITISDFDGVIPDTETQLKNIVQVFIPNPTDDEIRNIYDEMRLSMKVHDPHFSRSRAERVANDQKRGYIQLPGVFSPQLAYGILAKISGEQGLSKTSWVSQVRRELRLARRYGTQNLPDYIQFDPHVLELREYAEARNELSALTEVTNAKPILLTFGGDPEQPIKIASYVQEGIFPMAIILKERKQQALSWYLHPDHTDHLMTQVLNTVGVRKGVDVLYQTENIHDMTGVLEVISGITSCRGLLIRHSNTWIPEDAEEELPKGIRQLSIYNGVPIQQMKQRIHDVMSGPVYSSR